jgi:phosphatidylserine decarboxylase
MLTVGLTRAGAILGRIPLPTSLRPLVWGTYARAYGAHLEEAAAPVESYRTFQDFFTRRLQDNARPIDAAADVWTSPVDCLWLSHVRADADAVYPVKGNAHSLRELLADSALAEQMHGGWVSTFYLRPGDYHRIHAPCDMRLTSVRMVPGTLFPVNAHGQRVPGLFARNERWIFEAETAEGPLAMLWVGAMMVGSVAGSHPALLDLPRAPGRRSLDLRVARGEELGMFRFGSTVILVGTAVRRPALELPAEIRMGRPALLLAERTDP